MAGLQCQYYTLSKVSNLILFYLVFTILNFCQVVPVTSMLTVLNMLLYHNKHEINNHFLKLVSTQCLILKRRRLVNAIKHILYYFIPFFRLLVVRNYVLIEISHHNYRILGYNDGIYVQFIIQDNLGIITAIFYY